MNPGKMRLTIGICCVGTLVMSAGGMLFWRVADVLFPVVPQDAATEFLSVVAFFGAVAGLMLPFDLAGGILIPSISESRPLTLKVWLRQWLRSVCMQSLFYSTERVHYPYSRTG